MYKNHCKKQHSVHLLSSWSTINDPKPLQKTARRALPLFLHLTFSHAPQKVVQNRCKKQHIVQPHSFPVPSNRSTHPNPNCKTVAKPLQKTPFRAHLPAFHVLCYSFDFSHLTSHFQHLPTHAQHAATRPKTGATWLKTGLRRPKTCSTWPKTALRQA